MEPRGEIDKRLPVHAFFCLCIFFFLQLISFPLFAEKTALTEVRQWYKDNKNSARYQVYQEKIESIFVLTEAAELPVWILFEKLNQGAAKKADGESLVSSLKEEYTHLLTIHSLFTKLKIVYTEQTLYEECLKTLRQYMPDLGTELLEGLLKSSQHYKLERSALLLLCETIFQIKKQVSLGDKRLLELANALMSSTMHPKAWLSVYTLISRGKVGLVKDETLFSLVIETLARGGGFIQLNDELNRRLKK